MKDQKILYGIIIALVVYIIFVRREKYDEMIDPNDDVFEIVRKIEDAKKNQ
jgi:hypothetical protein|tara:strand:+ start:766 stop:918 length:153 start_codon:yes stop_codon:yes gene_type:complete